MFDSLQYFCDIKVVILVVLVSNCGLVEILVLRFVIPVACMYGEPLCNEVGA